MSDYPYGRKGTALVFYQDRVDEHAFEVTDNEGDNEVKRDGETVYVYEAPQEDDKGRGHFSTWEPADTGDGFIKVDSISGDDGMVYDKFNNA